MAFLVSQANMLLLYRHNNAAYMDTVIVQTSKWPTHARWRRRAVYLRASSEQLTSRSHSCKNSCKKIGLQFSYTVGIGIVCSCLACMRYEKKWSPIATRLQLRCKNYIHINNEQIRHKPSGVKMLFSSLPLGNLHNCSAPCIDTVVVCSRCTCFRHTKSAQIHNNMNYW